MTSSRIALAGKIGAGKTELARHLHRAHGYACVSSGELCRKITSLLFGDESRFHLNQIGDALRATDENIWMKALLRHHSSDRRIVIDSVRYLSEAVFLRAAGFEIWRVQASETVRWERLQRRSEAVQTGDLAHASETELDQFRYDFIFEGDTALSYKLVDFRICERLDITREIGS